MPIVTSGKVSHTTLESAGIGESLRFYSEVMGIRTHQLTEKAGLLLATNGHYVASVQVPRRAPQPLLNFYARPVADEAAVDAAHARITASRDEYRIQEITAPAREDPTKFGVSTYGFYVWDADGNCWRVEENNGPFGPAPIPDGAEPKGSIVPAGPISYVALECKNLAATARFYREYLGVDVEPGGPGYFFSRGNGGVHVVVVERGDELMEQTVMNHHGVTLWCDEAGIDALHAATKAVASEFGIKKVMPATHQHGSYSFYMQDQDTNWWEIEMWSDHIDPWARAGGAL